MNDNTAIDFYDRIVEGQDYSDTITLEHSSNAKLENVHVHPVDKETLGYVIQKLPEEMFDAVENADTPEEAESKLEEDKEMSLSAMSSETVEAFERLVKESLRHDELTTTQMNSIIDALDFGVLFELGGDIIDMSFSGTEAIQDFQKQA